MTNRLLYTLKEKKSLMTFIPGFQVRFWHSVEKSPKIFEISSENKKNIISCIHTSAVHSVVGNENARLLR
jgi:hypothetical protein